MLDFETINLGMGSISELKYCNLLQTVFGLYSPGEEQGLEH